MKKIKTTFTTFIALALLVTAVVIIGFTSHDQEQIDKNNLNAFLINDLKSKNKTVNQSLLEQKATQVFSNVKLFELSEQRDNKALNEFVSEAIFITIDKNALATLISTNPENMTLEIPLGNERTILVDLIKNEILDESFALSVINEMGTSVVPYTPGLYYKGVVRGKELSSIASISVFNDHIMGIISDEEGNWNLGPIKDNKNSVTDNYIFYSDAKRLERFNFKCGLEGLEEESTFPVQDLKQKLEEYRNGQDDPTSTVPVKVYFVADYSLFIAGGTIQIVADYITGFFNSVKTIYQNENILFEIAYIGVYTSPDPFINAPDTYVIRQMFGAVIQNNMQGGDIAHFLSVRTDISGGIAYIRSLCKQYNPADSSGSYAVSVIEQTYVPYPQYSWTVTVVTHEMGHNVGSRHTHACVWPRPGGIGPIDTCVLTPENSTFGGFPEACVQIPLQSGCYSPANGTIMSYCHFCNTTNLANGFGPLPGDTVRLRFAQAQGCLIGIENISSNVPSEYSLKQNYPNPFNPTTKIEFDLRKSEHVRLSVYDVTGRLITTLVNQKLSAGTYEVTFDALSLNSGVYFYKFISGDFAEVRKMVFLK
jgi:hypothetical protein